MCFQNISLAYKSLRKNSEEITIQSYSNRRWWLTRAKRIQQNEIKNGLLIDNKSE